MAQALRTVRRTVYGSLRFNKTIFKRSCSSVDKSNVGAGIPYDNVLKV